MRTCRCAVDGGGGVRGGGRLVHGELVVVDTEVEPRERHLLEARCALRQPPTSATSMRIVPQPSPSTHDHGDDRQRLARAAGLELGLRRSELADDHAPLGRHLVGVRDRLRCALEHLDRGVGEARGLRRIRRLRLDRDHRHRPDVEVGTVTLSTNAFGSVTFAVADDVPGTGPATAGETAISFVGGRPACAAISSLTGELVITLASSVARADERRDVDCRSMSSPPRSTTWELGLSTSAVVRPDGDVVLPAGELAGRAEAVRDRQTGDHGEHRDRDAPRGGSARACGGRRTTPMSLP